MSPKNRIEEIIIKSNCNSSYTLYKLQNLIVSSSLNSCASYLMHARWYSHDDGDATTVCWHSKMIMMCRGSKKNTTTHFPLLYVHCKYLPLALILYFFFLYCILCDNVNVIASPIVFAVVTAKSTVLFSPKFSSSECRMPSSSFYIPVRKLNMV